MNLHRYFPPTRLPRLLAGLALGCALATAARAHDPNEITADVLVARDRLEIMLTQTHLNALTACGLETRNRQNFGPRQFAEVKPALEACARTALEVGSGAGALVPTSVAATFSAEGEIEFRLSYPRPPAGVLKLRAALLDRLANPDCVLEVTLLVDGKFKGQHNLTLKESGLDIPVPAAATARPPPP